jgi:UDP-N-acetyl-D-mannosaminuronic acid transferase (WecB/TagA/CpsF family)
LSRDTLLRLLDSRVVAGLAWLFGLSPPSVAPGSDLTALLLRNHIQQGEQVTVVGLATADVAALAGRFGLAAPAHHNPPMGFDRDPAAFATAAGFVVAHPSRFVFLAVGSPRQERLAAAISATGQAVGTGLCIGASLAFLTGAEHRSPVWVQHAGLEWLFRLLASPRRLFVRYVFDSPCVIGLLLRERLLPRASRSAVRRF